MNDLIKVECNQCLSPLRLWVTVPLMTCKIYSIQYYVIMFVS